MTARLSQAVARALRDGGGQAVLGLAKTARGPVIEPTPDPDIFDVTFVFADRHQAPRRAGLFCAALPDGFARLADLGDGVFAGTFALPKGTRVKYHFCPEPPDGLDAAGLFRLAHSPQARRLDYFNPSFDQVHLRGLRVRVVESLLSLPGASAPLPVGRQPEVPAGSTAEFVIDSRALRRRKQVVVYRPADQATLAAGDSTASHRARRRAVLRSEGRGWTGRGKAEGGASQAPGGERDESALPVVLLLQGNEEWQDTAFFDNLIASEQVPPFAAVLLPERSFTVRLREFSGAASAGAAHTRFVVDELWPSLEDRGLGTGDAATVAGFSAGGLAAASLAIDEPGLFPRLAVVSGALHLTPGTDLNVVSDGSSALLRRLERAGQWSGHGYVAAGRFEDAWEKAIYSNAVALAQALRRLGATVRFDTGPTGHDGLSARAYLAAGLGWLLAR